MAPSASIVSNNDTLRGCPEMSYFLKEVFLANPKLNTSEYRNVTFSPLWAYNLFQHSDVNYNGSSWLKRSDIILNVGNLGFIFDVKDQFDAQGFFK